MGLYSSDAPNAVAKAIATVAVGTVMANGAAGLLTVKRDIADSSYNPQVMRFMTASGSEAMTNTNSGSQVGYIDTLGNIVMSGSISLSGGGLNSCDSLDTTSTGMIICGTDSGAGGTALSFADASTYFIQDAGGTMTGALKVRSSISGSYLFVDGLNSCDTIDTTSSGQLICGTDADTAGTLQDHYVNAGGDTMTGALKVQAAISGSYLYADGLNSCDTIDTTATGELICGTDAGASDMTDAEAIDKFVDEAGDTMTGDLMVKATASAATLTVTEDASIQGVLNTSGAIVVGGTITINGVAYTFPTSDGSATGKVLKTDSAGTLSWSDDLSSAFSFAELDSWFVSDNGDTMTGALKVVGSLSGSSLTVDNLQSCDTIDTSAAGVLSCGTDADTGASQMSDAESADKFVDEAGDTMTGDLMVQATMTGYKLFIGAMSGAGLTDCDTAGASKLLWDSTTERFSCGTDQGSTQMTDAEAADKFVDEEGDTMTGALKVRAAISGSYLFVDGLNSCDSIDTTATGQLICGTDAGAGMTDTELIDKFVDEAGDTMTGGLTVQATMTGYKLFVGAMSGAGLADCDSSGNKLLWDSTTERFSCGTTEGSTQMTDAEAADKFVDEAGDTMTGDLLGISAQYSGTMSGDILHGETTISSSGTLVADGAVSFKSTVRVNGVTYTFPSNDGTSSGKTLTTDGAGNLSWATDQGTPVLDAHYVNAGGDTMTGALIVKAAISGASLEISNLTSCDSIDTDSSGNLSCGTDDTVGAEATDKYVDEAGDTMTGALNVTMAGTGLVITNNTNYEEFSFMELWGSDRTPATDDSGDINVYMDRGGDGLGLSHKIEFTVQGVGAIKSTGYKFMAWASDNWYNFLHIQDDNDVVINQDGSGIGFRVEGQSDVDLIHTDSPSDTVTIGSDTNLGKFGIDGDEDEIQFTVQGNATQTSDYLQVEQSDGTIVFVIDGNGEVGIGDISPTVPLEVLGNMSGNALVLSDLQSCDTIDTNATGTLACGTDADSGDDVKDYYVNAGGDTMTGALIVQAAISGASLEVSNLTSCDSIDTDSSGNLSCGTDAGASSLTTAEATDKFVDESGDTMTGNLVINALLKSQDIQVTAGVSVEGNLSVTGSTVIDTDLTVGKTTSGSVFLASGGLVDLQAVPVVFALVNTGTSLATGAIAGDWTMPFGGEFLWVHCRVDNPATDGTTQLDIDIGGTSIFSTNPTIDATENDTDTATASPIIDHANNEFSRGDEITFTVDTAAGNVIAQGLKCRGVVRKLSVPLTY